jgi:hypothetical protein
MTILLAIAQTNKLRWVPWVLLEIIRKMLYESPIYRNDTDFPTWLDPISLILRLLSLYRGCDFRYSISKVIVEPKINNPPPVI